MRTCSKAESGGDAGSLMNIRRQLGHRTPFRAESGCESRPMSELLQLLLRRLSDSSAAAPRASLPRLTDAHGEKQIPVEALLTGRDDDADIL